MVGDIESGGERFGGSAPAQVGQGSVTGDLAEPGAETSRFPNFWQFTPRGEKCLLSRIFAGREIVEDAEGNTANHRLMPGDNLDESGFIASTGEVDQVRIGFSRRWAGNYS
jgi:hypothetical protein